MRAEEEILQSQLTRQQAQQDEEWKKKLQQKGAKPNATRAQIDALFKNIESQQTALDQQRLNADAEMKARMAQRTRPRRGGLRRRARPLDLWVPSRACADTRAWRSGAPARRGGVADTSTCRGVRAKACCTAQHCVRQRACGCPTGCRRRALRHGGQAGAAQEAEVQEAAWCGTRGPAQRMSTRHAEAIPAVETIPIEDAPDVHEVGADALFEAIDVTCCASAVCAAGRVRPV
jgi:hypothetical protein